MPFTGRCLCGGVRYELDGELGPLVNCHCQFCRRAHGAAFSTVSPVSREAVRFVAGEELIAGHEGRRFCKRCATRLFNTAESMPERLMLVVSSLDQDSPDGPIMHINLESKASWHEILDDLPRFPGFPPGVGADSD